MDIMNARRMYSGHNQMIEGHLFVYFADTIEVWKDGDREDIFSVDPAEVTTTRHFEEKAMWWLHDWNRI